MATTRFETVIRGTGNNTGIEVPPQALDALGAGKRPAVAVSVGEYRYETSVGAMGGMHLVPLSKAHREASGLAAGDAVSVVLELLDAPRAVEVPEDLALALDGAGVRAAFDALAPSRREEHVRSVVEAKAEATRQRRVTKVVDGLAGR
jgi:hypothetical protein